MLINTASFNVLLMLSLAVYAGGLQLSLDKSQQGPYCGVLQCLADEGNLPHNVLSVISLTIYDITRSNIPLKLASVSAFTPGVVVEASKMNVVNATGSVSKNQAGLILGLLSDADCLYASYQCELDFVNNIGQSDVLRESITPADDNATILHILSEMAAQLKTQTEVLNRALQEFSRIERFLNASCVPPDTSGSEVDKTHVSCFRGMASTNPREKINLWNVTVSLCDTKTDGGGWIVIQRRTKGDVNFFRSWNDYKKGFGTPDTDFWIGNDIIHNLTSQGYNELRIEFQQDDDSYFGQYSNFSLASEQAKYRISISGISGSVYDYMMDNNGSSFAAYDNHDQYLNCPSRLQSGWWFSTSCGSTNLNGVWGATGDTGLTWGTYKSLSRSEMKVRRA